MTYLTSDNENAVINAQRKITIACGFPNKAGTLRWAIVQKAEGQKLWFIQKPNGYNEFTADHMMKDVDMRIITEQEYNPAWFPIITDEI